MTSVLSVLDSVIPICCFRSHRTNSVPPKTTTRYHRFHCREDNLPYVPVVLFQLHSMILVLYQHHNLYAALLCDSRTKPILTHTPEDPFLEIDVKGGERSHQSLFSSKGEREKNGERGNHIKGPRCLVFKRREVTCL